MDIFREQFRGIFQRRVAIHRRPEVYVYSSQAGFKEKMNSSARGKYSYHYEGGYFTEHSLFTYVEGKNDTRFLNFYHPILLHEGTTRSCKNWWGSKASLRGSTRDSLPIFNCGTSGSRRRPTENAVRQC